MAKVTGRVTIKVNGATLLSKRGATLDFGGVKRNPVVGSDSVHGYSEEIVPPMITCTISHTADTSLQAIANYTDETAVFITDTGHSYVLAQAFLTEPPKLKEQDGEVDLSLSGVSCDEI